MGLPFFSTGPESHPGIREMMIAERIQDQAERSESNRLFMELPAIDSFH